MVPLPAQEPDRAWNGLVEAWSGAGAAVTAKAIAAVAARAEFLRNLPIENMG
jgi:hypothetical protein